MADDYLRHLILPLPISATSAATEIQVPAIVLNTPGLYFEIFNPNAFDIALEGTRADGEFLLASRTMGWQVLARERTPVRASKRPARISVVAVGTSGNPLPDPGFSYAGCYVYLNYLTKGN